MPEFPLSDQLSLGIDPTHPKQQFAKQNPSGTGIHAKQFKRAYILR
jgi:hypothetical protein